MALYNLNEFMWLIKSDVGIKDIPLPVSDNDLLKRFEMSALTDFSVLCPRVETFMVNQNEVVSKGSETGKRYTEYRIPPHVYQGTVVLGVTRFEAARPDGYADFYTPNAHWNTPDAVITAMGDLRMASGVASALAKAPTFQFRSPDRILVYNGWAGGVYEVEVLLRHDLSLSTIPPGAFRQLRELAVLDMKAYLYNELKRKDGGDVGIGTIQLKIDDWANADADRLALLKQWDEEGANLDIDHVRYF